MENNNMLLLGIGGLALYFLLGNKKSDSTDTESETSDEEATVNGLFDFGDSEEDFEEDEDYDSEFVEDILDELEEVSCGCQS